MHSMPVHGDGFWKPVDGDVHSPAEEVRAMKLIVGLGNPGSEYAGTRHNVGFDAIELLAKKYDIAIQKRNFKAVYGEGEIAGQKVLLARPMTYMNLSGEAVSALLRYYKLEIADMIVLVDDVALPTGKLRLRFKGSSGGQNGLKNIIQHLGTEEFARIRIGVGAAKSSGDLRGHVLSKFRKEELPAVEEALELAVEAIVCALGEGFEMAMNRYNVGEKSAVESEVAREKRCIEKPVGEQIGG